VDNHVITEEPRLWDDVCTTQNEESLLDLFKSYHLEEIDND